jgi:hypothetical protein
MVDERLALGLALRAAGELLLQRLALRLPQWRM